MNISEMYYNRQEVENVRSSFNKYNPIKRGLKLCARGRDFNATLVKFGPHFTLLSPSPGALDRAKACLSLFRLLETEFSNKLEGEAD